MDLNILPSMLNPVGDGLEWSIQLEKWRQLHFKILQGVR